MQPDSEISPAESETGGGQRWTNPVKRLTGAPLPSTHSPLFDTSRKALRCRFGRHDWAQIAGSVLCIDCSKPRTMRTWGATYIGSAEGESFLARLSDQEIKDALDRVKRMQEARNAK